MKYNKRMLFLSLFTIFVILLQTISFVGARPIGPIIDPPPGGTTTFRVYGYVKDSNTGAAIPYASVGIYTDRGTYLGYATASSSGYFSKYVTCAPPDFFKIVVSKTGYNTITVYKQYSRTTCYCGTIYLSGSTISYNINGRVIASDTSNPVSGATAKIYRNVLEGWSLIATKTTGSDGTYQYTYSTTSAMSQCRVVASYLGYNDGASTVTVSSSTVNMGDVMVFAPATTYTVSGVIKDVYTGSDICGSTVDVHVFYSNNWFSLGEADTNLNNGGFTFSYTCYDDWESVSLTISKEYFVTKEVSISSSGPTYNFGTINMIRDSLPVGITSVNLGYDSEIVDEFWVSAGVLSPTITSDGSSVTATDSGQGGEGYSSYALGKIDLHGWSGVGDMQITVCIRSQCDIAVPTLFSMGLVSYNGNPAYTNEHLWYYEYSLPSSTDTHYMEVTATIPRAFSSSEPGIQSPGTYGFFWGYIDGSNEDILQRVSMDYYYVEGDGYGKITTDENPAGILYHNRAGTTTIPDGNQFNTGTTDVDAVTVVYSSLVDTTTLGFCSIDSNPVIVAGIDISLEDDFISWNDSDITGSSDYVVQNYVDSVTVSFKVYSYDQGNYGEPAGGVIDILSVKVSELDGISNGAEFDFDSLMGIILEAVGLYPGVGSYVKFGANCLMWTITPQDTTNTLTIDDLNAGSASATYDFAEHVIFPPTPPKGSTDFKILVAAALDLPIEGGVYKVEIDYDVIFKEVRETTHVDLQGMGSTSYYSVFSEPQNFEQTFNLIQLPNLNAVHLVEMTCSEIGHSISLSGNGATMYDTIYGSKWKVVNLDTVGGTLSVSADSSDFVQMEVSYWKPGELRLCPLIYLDYSFQYTFISGASYVKFNAIYN